VGMGQFPARALVCRADRNRPLHSTLRRWETFGETHSSLSHITLKPISLSRLDPVPGFVRSRQRFVRLSQASVGLDQSLQRSQEER
jgi:hypothetical protein